MLVHATSSENISKTDTAPFAQIAMRSILVSTYEALLLFPLPEIEYFPRSTVSKSEIGNGRQTPFQSGYMNHQNARIGELHSFTRPQKNPSTISVEGFCGPFLICSSVCNLPINVPFRTYPCISLGEHQLSGSQNGIWISAGSLSSASRCLIFWHLSGGQVSTVVSI